MDAVIYRINLRPWSKDVVGDEKLDNKHGKAIIKDIVFRF